MDMEEDTEEEGETASTDSIQDDYKEEKEKLFSTKTKIFDGIKMRLKRKK